METELCILSEARNWRQKCIFYIRQNVCTYLELRMNLPGTERNAKRIGNFYNSLKLRLVAGRKCFIKACPAQAGISGELGHASCSGDITRCQQKRITEILNPGREWLGFMDGVTSVFCGKQKSRVMRSGCRNPHNTKGGNLLSQAPLRSSRNFLKSFELVGMKGFEPSTP